MKNVLCTLHIYKLNRKLNYYRADDDFKFVAVEPGDSAEGTCKRLGGKIAELDEQTVDRIKELIMGRERKARGTLYRYKKLGGDNEERCEDFLLHLYKEVVEKSICDGYSGRYTVVCQLLSESESETPRLSPLIIALSTVSGVVVLVLVIALLSCFGPDCLKVSGHQLLNKKPLLKEVF